MVLCMIFFTAIPAAAEPVYQSIWTRLAGTPYEDDAWDLAIDGSGFIYLAGKTAGGIDGNFNSGGDDIVLMKYDQAGSRMWTKQIGSPSNDEAFGVAVDYSGNIYVSGRTQGSLGGVNAGGVDIFLMKLAPDGMIQWIQQYGSEGDDLATRVTVDGNGNAYVTGYTNGGLESYSNSGANDLFLVKYDAGGNRQWTKQMGTSVAFGIETPYNGSITGGVAVDGNSDIYVAGITQAGLDGNPCYGGKDIVLMKFDQSGNRQWTRQSGTIADDQGTAVMVSGGNVYVAGTTNSGLDGNNFYGVTDMFLMQYDWAGNKMWTKQVGTSTHDYAFNLASDIAGNIYLIGMLHQALNGDYGYEYRCDIGLFKFDPVGGILQSRKMGYMMMDHSYAIGVDPSGYIFIGGQTENPLGGVPNAGGMDIFLAKFDGNGSGFGPGAVWQWGSNALGWSSVIPVPVEGLAEVVEISGGMEHSLALQSDGTVKAWGENTGGQLGDGSYTTSFIPVTVSAYNKIIKIASGWFHSLAVLSDDTVVHWGNYSSSGSAAFPDLAPLDSNTPLPIISFDPGVRSISGGGWHSMALSNNGSLWTWGANNFGQLGDGTNTNRVDPVQVTGLPTNVITVSAGVEHSLALLSDGTVRAWGNNTDGQLGDGTNNNSAVPVQVSGLDNVIAIFAGGWHSMAIKNDGTVWTWGRNAEGQLGDGTNANSNIPVQVIGLDGVSAIDAECTSSVALRADGTVWEWGGYYDGSGWHSSNSPVQRQDISGVTAIAGGMDQRIVFLPSTSMPAGHVITATAGAGGSISPSGTVTVIPGASQTFNITPETGYRIADVVVDGVSAGATSSYTFDNVTADHTISASFAPSSYTITASAGANGSISPSGAVAVNYGDSQIFTVTPNAGYYPVMSGTCGGSLSGTGPIYSYTTSTVTSDCTVIADFLIDTHRVSPSAGIAGDEGNVYQLDILWGSYGTGNGQFDSPFGVAVDASGNVYVSDTNNGRIQKFDAQGAYVTQWGGSGNGLFEIPYGVAVDGSGNVYVADPRNNRIQKFDSSGTLLTQWDAYGSGDRNTAYWLYGVAVDVLGNVYVADVVNHRIQKFDSNGTLLTQWGAQGSGAGQFSYPTGVAVGASGNVYVSDKSNHRIQKFNSEGTYLTQWGSYGTVAGQFYYPMGVAVDAEENVYVSDGWNNRIQKFDSNGTYLTQWGSLGSDAGQFWQPFGAAVDASGNVYIAEWVNHRIQKFQRVFTGTSSDGGSISPATPQTVNHNETTSFTATANTGYHVKSVTGCGGTLSDSTYTTGPVTGDCSVKASFEIDTYTITASAGDNGTISPSGAVAVKYGESRTFEITADAGYHILTVTGCGGTLTGNTYATGPIAGDCAVNASFAADAYTVSVSIEGSGTGRVTSSPNGISCAADCSEVYNYGTPVTLTATPGPDSVFTGWNGNGCSGTGSCTIIVSADAAATAAFTRAVEIVNPNGGEIRRRGNPYPISWRYAGPGTSVRIELLKSGIVNRLITANAPIGSNGTGSYVWYIPYDQIPGADYKVRVTNTANRFFSDTSARAFTITP